MDADGSNARQLVNIGSSNYGRYLWSPDGDMVFYWLQAPADQALYVINADGTDNTRLLRAPQISLFDFNYDRLIFGADLGDWTSHLYTIDGVGMEPVQIPTENGAHTPAWRPRPGRGR
jgi:hypothetical protein